MDYSKITVLAQQSRIAYGTYSLAPSERKCFTVSYQSEICKKSDAVLRISLKDNSEEDIVVHLVGEAFDDDFIMTISHANTDNLLTDKNLSEEEIQGKGIKFKYM